MYFIAFIDSALYHLPPIPSQKAKKVSGCVGCSNTNKNCFKGVFRKKWKEKCGMEKETFREQVTFSIHFYFCFEFLKKVAGVFSLSSPCEASIEPNPLSPLLAEPCWIYPALLSIYYLDTLSASDDYGCNSFWGFAAP